MRLPIYLDYMATTPVDARVVKKMLACLDYQGNFANPSSLHGYGWQAAEAIKTAREQVADLLHADVREIIWTSGATEANNLALKGAAQFYQRQGKHIITMASEHKAVLDVCEDLQQQGFEITYLQPQKNGLLALDDLAAALRKDTILASIMWVNNETGVIQDIKAISELLHSKGVLLHVDAAQTVGKIPVNVHAAGIDLMSLSAHKFYGPKGIGALFVRRQPRVRLAAQMHGGGHEQGLRSGTLPTHQIVGLGEAAAVMAQELSDEILRLQKLRDQLWQGLKKIPGVALNGDGQQRVVHNLNVSFAGVDGEALITALRDLAISTGSACNAASIEPSHVLMSLGLSRELAQSSVRFSLGRFTTAEEIDYSVKYIVEQLARLRELSPVWDAVAKKLNDASSQE